MTQIVGWLVGAAVVIVAVSLFDVVWEWFWNDEEEERE